MKKGLKRLFGRALSVGAAMALSAGSVFGGTHFSLFSTIGAEAANVTVTDWGKLEDAIKSSGTVTLGSNITAISGNKNLTIQSGVTIVLDLNGKTIDRASTGTVLYNEGTLTIKDSAGGGKITGVNTANSSAIANATTGTLTISGGSISGNSGINQGGAVTNYGTMYMNGGKISGNYSYYGAGIYNTSGTLYVNGGEISDNTGLSGVGIYNLNGELYLNGGIISGNVAKGDSRDSVIGGVLSNKAVYIQGSPVVIGNTGWANSRGTKFITSNISAPRLDLKGALSNASLGFYLNSAGTITYGWSTYMGTTDPSTIFSADNTSYTVTTSGGEVYLKLGGSSTVTDYVVSYDANGGKGSMPGRTVPSGTTITLPDCSFDPPTGKTFDKWQIGSNTYSPNGTYKVTGNTTIKALWKTAPTTYTVSFDPNGGGSTMNPVTVNAGASYFLPACGFTPPANMTFDKWQVGTKTYAKDESITVNQNTVVKALWKTSTTKIFTITFEANGGEGSMKAKTVIATSSSYSYTLPSCTFTPPDNMTFDKWQVGTQTYDAGKPVTITGNTTVKAIWKSTAVTTYSVTFDSNGGTGSMSKVTGLTAGSSYTLPSCSFTPPDHMTFDKWQVGTKTYAAGKPINITGNTTVKALWKALTYTVKFNANGGSGTMSDATDQPYGSSYPLPDCLFDPPKDKTFDKWQVGTTKYNAGTSITITGNMTVYATWKTLTYTVTFDANGGTGSMSKVTGLTAGSSYTLPDCSFTPPDHMTFDKWQVGTKTYDAGKPVTITGNTTVKALWKEAASQVLLGDANGDGRVNMLDYALMQRYLLNSNTQGVIIKNIDFNNDNVVNMLDYAAMQRLLLS